MLLKYFWATRQWKAMMNDIMAHGFRDPFAQCSHLSFNKQNKTFHLCVSLRSLHPIPILNSGQVAFHLPLLLSGEHTGARAASTVQCSNIAWQNEMELELLFRHSSPRPGLSWLSSGICLKNGGVIEQHSLNTRSVSLKSLQCSCSSGITISISNGRGSFSNSDVRFTTALCCIDPAKMPSPVRIPLANSFLFQVNHI